MTQLDGGESSSDFVLRLIDVKHRRLVESAVSGGYVALSYAWGTIAGACLTTATKGRFDVDGAFSDDDSEVPETIKMALWFCKSIGGRYLWCDSYCIVQDDARDCAHVTANIGVIYSYANLTIIAGYNVHQAGFCFLAFCRTEAEADAFDQQELPGVCVHRSLHNRNLITLTTEPQTSPDPTERLSIQHMPDALPAGRDPETSKNIPKLLNTLDALPLSCSNNSTEQQPLQGETTASRLVAQHQAVTKIQDDILLRRHRLSNERQYCTRLKSAAQDDSAEFMTALRLAQDQGFRERLTVLGELADRAQRTHSDLSLQEHHLVDLEEQLTALEYAHGKAQAKLIGDLAKTLSRLPESLPPGERQDLCLSQEDTSVLNASTGTPSVIERYHRKLNDYHGLLSRLEELERNTKGEPLCKGHDSALSLPAGLEPGERSSSRGDGPDRTRASVEVATTRKTDLLRELETAQGDVLLLRQECLEAGYDPDGGELDSDTGDRSPGFWLPNTFIAPTVSAEIDIPAIMDDSTPTSFMSAFVNTRHRINLWLMDVLRANPLEWLRYRGHLVPAQGDIPSISDDWVESVWTSWTTDEAATGVTLSNPHTVRKNSSSATNRTPPKQPNVADATSQVTLIGGC
ncbi:hypothetical protein LTR66_008304 [Elasticomyces elasticus]|nr:hypothetical protein LTR66_008304 [Elasticomyces elasticus]